MLSTDVLSRLRTQRLLHETRCSEAAEVLGVSVRTMENGLTSMFNQLKLCVLHKEYTTREVQKLRKGKVGI